MLFNDSLCDLRLDLLLSLLSIVNLQLVLSLPPLLRIYTLIPLLRHFLGNLRLSHRLNRPIINRIEFHFLQMAHDQYRS